MISTLAPFGVEKTFFFRMIAGHRITTLKGANGARTHFKLIMKRVVRYKHETHAYVHALRPEVRKLKVELMHGDCAFAC